MTEQHRAKPEVWAAVEKLGKNEMDMLNCVLELRARVEELEAAAKPTESNYPAKPDSSLVERVSDALMESVKDQRSVARAAILEIAAWLRSSTDLVHGPQCALWLEQELSKPS